MSQQLASKLLSSRPQLQRSMTQQPTPKPRPTRPQLHRSGNSHYRSTRYTSFQDLGVDSPRQEAFGKDEEDESAKEGSAEQAGLREGCGRREKEVMKGDDSNRERSGSPRWIEWLVRPKEGSSPS